MDLIRAGHRLGVLARSKQVHFALHNAAWQQGFVLVPLPPDAPRPELASMLDDAGVDVVVADPASAAAAEAVHGARPVLLCNEDGEPAGHVEGTIAAPGDGGGTYAMVRTSGTTGDPSWVRVPRPALEAHRKAAMRRLGCREDSVWLHAVPMHHMAGIGVVDRCLHGGGRLVLQERFDAPAAHHAMQAHGVTHVSLVPTMLRRLLAVDRPVPRFLQCVLIGGDRLPDPLAAAALEAGWPVHASYGLTETCGQVATARPEEIRACPGTVGTPLDGVQVRIVDGDTEAAPGRDGEIIVSGPTVCADGPLRTGDVASPFMPSRKTWVDGPLRTGDVGHLDDAGRLFVTGRLDDRITTGGKKVDPARVEAVLAAHPSVAVACVVGVPDDDWGQRVVAVVEPAGGAPDPDDLQAHCRDRLEAHEVPKEIHLGDVPRTEGGKVRRATVRGGWSHGP